MRNFTKLEKHLLTPEEEPREMAENPGSYSLSHDTEASFGCRDSFSRGRDRALVAAEQISQAAAFLAALLRCSLLLFPRICFASAREP